MQDSQDLYLLDYDRSLHLHNERRRGTLSAPGDYGLPFTTAFGLRAGCRHGRIPRRAESLCAAKVLVAEWASPHDIVEVEQRSTTRRLGAIEASRVICRASRVSACSASLPSEAITERRNGTLTAATATVLLAYEADARPFDRSSTVGRRTQRTVQSVVVILAVRFAVAFCRTAVSVSTEARKRRAYERLQDSQDVELAVGELCRAPEAAKAIGVVLARDLAVRASDCAAFDRLATLPALGQEAVGVARSAERLSIAGAAEVVGGGEGGATNRASDRILVGKM
jgi:hypothetical protein